MPKLRVLELTTSFPRAEGDFSGLFIYKKDKALIDKGVNIYVLAPTDENTKKKEILEQVSVNRFDYFFTAKLQKLVYHSGTPENLKKSFLAKIQVPFLILGFFLRTLSKGRDKDIIHAQWSLAGLGGVLAAKILRKPFVLTMHGAEVFVLKNNPIIKFLLSKVDFLITNSTFTLNHIVKYHNFDMKKAKVIPFGTYDYQRKEIYKDKNLWHDTFSIQMDKRIIFSLGRHVERKGFEYLLMALKLILQKRKDVHLVLGGKGPREASLKALAEKLGLKDHCTFIPFIEENILGKFFSNADIFVLPSIVDKQGDTEGLGVVNIEALTYGCPVVSTNVGGIPDVIINEETGLLVEQKNSEQLANAIIRLLEDENLRNRIIKGGLIHIKKNFSWDGIAKSHIEIYSNILKSSRKIVTR